jgi:hypothetical protein
MSRYQEISGYVRDCHEMPGGVNRYYWMRLKIGYHFFRKGQEIRNVKKNKLQNKVIQPKQGREEDQLQSLNNLIFEWCLI